MNEKLKLIYDKYKDKFIGSFHTALWHTLIDGPQVGSTFIYIAVLSDKRGLIMGLAKPNEGGYYPTPAGFAEGVTYDEACEITLDINKMAFDYPPSFVLAIELRSTVLPM